MLLFVHSQFYTSNMFYTVTYLADRTSVNRLVTDMSMITY